MANDGVAVKLIDTKRLSIPEIQPGEAMLVDWTAEQYFADTSALTRSSLSLCAAKPRTFWRRWEKGLRVDVPDDSSDAKDRGTYVHLAVLELPQWVRRVGLPEVPRPKGASGNASKSTPEGRRARELYDRWKAAVDQREKLMSTIPDRIDVSLAEFHRIQQMVASAWLHPEAAALLSAPGRNEQTVLWREPTTGLLVKCRLDRLVELGPEHAYGTDLETGLVIADLKTSTDPEPNGFGRSVLRYGYDVQDALYSDAVAALTGRAPVFYFVVVGSDGDDDGYHETAVYKLPPDAIERGREEYRKRLAEILERRADDNWKKPWERGVVTLALPRWSNRR